MIIKKYEVIIVLTLVFLLISFNTFNVTPPDKGAAATIPIAPDKSFFQYASVDADGRIPFSSSKKIIALTFDDGPHPVYTERLLDTLKKFNVPATFFLVGKQVEKYPHLARRISQCGFSLGGHTYTHSHLTLFANSKESNLFSEELEKTRLIIKTNTGIDTYLFRPPGGKYDDNVVRLSRQNGYRMVLWNILPRDHIDGLSSDEISNRVISGALSQGGGIVLLHSGRPSTIDALEKIITELRSKGYEFVLLN